MNLDELSYLEIESKWWEEAYEAYEEWIKEVIKETSKRLEKEYNGPIEMSVETLCDADVIHMLFKIEKLGDIELKKMKVGKSDCMWISDFLEGEFEDPESVAYEIYDVVSICY